MQDMAIIGRQTPFIQLLNFFKMAFYLFAVYSILAIAILMPINWKVAAILSNATLRNYSLYSP